MMSLKQFVASAVATVCVLSTISHAAILHWDSQTCQDVGDTHLRGTGCVAEGSIETTSPVCSRCMFNYQCASGWCVDSWKLCYEQNTKCKGGYDAGCKSCSSAKNADLSKCECKSTDFPNNWVTCTDGSGNMDQYSLDNTYNRVEDEATGGLSESDQFAVVSQCYHNKFREGAGLQALKWNSELALFAKNWVDFLAKYNKCKMKHSGNSKRSNLAGFSYVGENLYWFATSGHVTQQDIPGFGQKSAEGWYEEIMYYQYPGENVGWGECEKRNKDGREQVGHFTQMMWDDTTEVGCDYATCANNGESIVVSCVYGPGGNYPSRHAFNDTVRCNLDKWDENEGYGGLPTCAGFPNNCEGGHSHHKSDGKSKNDNGQSMGRTDGVCPGKWGGTCEFPWEFSGLGEFTTCQDALNRLVPHNPWCLTESGQFDMCNFEDVDPDCQI